MIYLVLIIHGHALWGAPQPYPDMMACDAAGMLWDTGSPPDAGTRGHYCLPAPIVAPESTQRAVNVDKPRWQR